MPTEKVAHVGFLVNGTSATVQGGGISESESREGRPSRGRDGEAHASDIRRDRILDLARTWNGGNPACVSGPGQRWMMREQVAVAAGFRLMTAGNRMIGWVRPGVRAR